MHTRLSAFRAYDLDIVSAIRGGWGPAAFKHSLCRGASGIEFEIAFLNGN
jgi:hypothetical protein